MFQQRSISMTIVLLGGGLLFPALHAAQPTNTEDLHPFTHLAYIPAGADLGTIRFEKAKLVQVPISIRYAANSSDCQQAASGEPGGSFACTGGKTESSAPAWEVTYSVSGQPLGADEYGGRNFTFSVYFRPEELAPGAIQALSGGRATHSAAAAYFGVSTIRETVSQVAIDTGQSRFCEGGYMDGSWVRGDAGCQDIIRYTSVKAPSGYLSVKVDAVAGHVISADAAVRR